MVVPGSEKKPGKVIQVSEIGVRVVVLGSEIKVRGGGTRI